MLKRLLLTAVLLMAVMLFAAAPALADVVPAETGEVISHNVTLRSDHSSDADTIMRLKNGDTFDILDRSDHWLYIAYTDPKTSQVYNGWVSSYYVAENPIHITLRESGVAFAYPSSSSKRVGTIPAYTRLTVIAQLDKYWVVSFRDAAGSIPKSTKVWLDEELEVWSGAPVTVATVTKKTITRTGPGTKWSSVKTLKVGETVEILDTDGDWCVIKHEDAIAYIKHADVSY